MATAIYRKSGATLDYTATADIAAGTFVAFGGFNCLAQWDIAAGETGALKILQRGEVVEVTVDTALGEIAAGATLYVSDGEVSTKGTTVLGYAAAAVGATDTTFSVVCA